MAKSLKYPVRRSMRLSTDTAKALKKRAKIMGLSEAEALRYIVEHSLTENVMES